jgi:hypothetical protein
MFRLAVRAAAAALVVAGAGGAAADQPRPIEVKAGDAFPHAHSGLQFPARVAGLARTRVLELEQDQLDVIADYGTVEQGEVFTFYIFRNVSGDVPVWFDRARWVLEQREALGKAEATEVGAFVPPGRREAAGLAASYALSGKDFRSTGVALMPLGEWYVKLRASSKTRSPTELLAAMKGAIAELRWPGSLPSARAAVPVQACTGALATAGEAKPVASRGKSGSDALMSSILGGVIIAGVKDKAQPAARPVVWCRDTFQTMLAGAYRADGASDTYLLAVADAGRAIWAVPDPAGQLDQLTDRHKAKKPSYVVEFELMTQTLMSPPYDRLPPPEQAIAIVREGKFASGTPAWGKGKGNININTSVMK